MSRHDEIKRRVESKMLASAYDDRAWLLKRLERAVQVLDYISKGSDAGASIEAGECLEFIMKRD